jgi:hypothetical protein
MITFQKNSPAGGKGVPTGEQIGEVKNYYSDDSLMDFPNP